MNYLGKNLKYLRKKHGLTQEQCAEKLGVKRAIIGAYEEGRVEPKINTLLTICNYFKVNLDDFLTKELGTDTPPRFDATGARLRVLPITTTPEKELCSIVHKKASAGYTTGFDDVDYVGSLPKFSLPFPELSPEKTYRLFQIQGESMLPVKPGAYMICEYVLDWTTITSGQCYVIVTATEGIVYKRVDVVRQHESLKLISDNTLFEPYEISFSDILEVWAAKGLTDFKLPNPKEYLLNSYEVALQLSGLQTQINELHKKL